VHDRATTKPSDGPPGSEGQARTFLRSPLIGRDRELFELGEVLGRAIDFQAPQLVTVIGHQGTGKTRLIEEAIDRVLTPPTRVYRGSAIDTSVGAGAGDGRYEAIGAALRDRFGLTLDEKIDAGTGEVLRAEIERLFASADVDEIVHLIGSFLQIPLPDSPFFQVLEESQEQKDELARTVLRRFIERDSADGPIVLVFDDLQWADDDTLRLLQELGCGLGGSPVVVVVAARPDMIVRCPNWGAGATDHVRIDLRNLEPDDAEVMFRRFLVLCDGLTDDLMDDMIELTGGNPALIEELVRLFLTNGTIDSSGARWRIDRERAAATELPIGIEEAIEARIAALEPGERDLLEKGAVFGNVFWAGAVIALSRVEAVAAEEAAREDGAPPRHNMSYDWSDAGEPVRRQVLALVDDLVERDYLLRLEPEDSTIAGDVELVFKHNLERELIAKSTEAGRLARYHRRAAQWLETKLSARSEEQLEFLAQLYERGGDARRAARCYLAGGDKARDRYANNEAVDLYARGLAMIEDDDALARLDALHNLGDVLDLVGRTDEALAKFSEMLKTAWMFDNMGKGGAAHGRLGRIYRRRGEYDRAVEHLQEAHKLFSVANDQRGVAGALDDIGKVKWLLGDYAQALAFYRQSLSIRRALGDRRSIALSLANIGRVHCDSGAFKAAVDQFREALDLRRDIGDMVGVVQSLCDLGGVHAEDGNHEMALELLGEAHAISIEIGDKLSQAHVLSRVGECKAAMGDGQAAVERLQDAIDLATALGDRVALSDCLLRLAEVQIGLGAAREAFEGASRALTIGQAVSSSAHIGRAHCVLAEATWAGGAGHEDKAGAEEHYRQAVEILAGMKNELELARCYRSFALFREQSGDADDAAKLRRRADEIFGRLRGAAATD
jgi:tetratricopeptide (TPR) repeat protein